MEPTQQPSAQPVMRPSGQPSRYVYFRHLVVFSIKLAHLLLCF